MLTAKRIIHMRVTTVLMVVAACLLSGCPSAPEECKTNVVRVTALAFDGPAALQLHEGDDQAYSGYSVAATIEKAQSGEAAIACYAVRDVDPWWKLFWSVDDVLDANFIRFSESATQVNLEEHFTLIETNDEVCGFGAIPGKDRVKGCSGEDEAEVYLDVFGPDGDDSSIQSVRIP
jgi:hypothetical protein